MTEANSLDPNALAELLTKHADKLPPVHKWNPDFCGDIAIRIASDGTWYYQDSAITRQRLVRLFSTVLRHDPDGGFYLVTPAEKLRIQVDDAPLLATDLEILQHKNQQLLFTTNCQDQVIADTEHPLTLRISPNTGKLQPYLRVRDRLDALISRSVYYQLADIAETHNGKLGVWSSGLFFNLEE